MHASTLLLWMLVGHILCDYPLQCDFMAKGKNHRAPFPGVPWYQLLVSHSVIHAACVTLLSGSFILGGLELISHTLIDYGKCDGWYSFNCDQALHAACKCVWVALWVLLGRPS